MTDAKKTIESLAAKADDIPVRGQPVAQRHNTGKPDLTLIPWSTLPSLLDRTEHANPIKTDYVHIIRPAELWYRREISSVKAYKYAFFAYAYDGRLMIHDAAEALNYGSKKYSAYNWELGFKDAHTVYSSMCRHYDSLSRGETHDRESGLHHLCHIAFGYLAMFKLQSDGRPEAPGPSNAGPVENFA